MTFFLEVCVGFCFMDMVGFFLRFISAKNNIFLKEV